MSIERKANSKRLFREENKELFQQKPPGSKRLFRGSNNLHYVSNAQLYDANLPVEQESDYRVRYNSKELRKQISPMIAAGIKSLLKPDV